MANGGVAASFAEAPSAGPASLALRRGSRFRRGFGAQAGGGNTFLNQIWIVEDSGKMGLGQIFFYACPGLGLQQFGALAEREIRLKT